MQDLMKQIVEMDKKARRITDSAQKEKVDSQKEIVQKREQIHANYLERARKHIEKAEPQERAVAEAQWEKKKEKFSGLSKNLDGLYQKNGDKWVAEIVNRVLGA